ncbi:hypothetical protein ACH5RR_002496 [Cinchona calisaya]|uniref:Uncharacterized protein n=1 Tax=Cinchona calisaya TaxID=153742 RepID=A0ABD3B6E1_9GENT
MINTRKLLKMARKWQARAALGRKRLLFPGSNNGEVGSSSSSGCPSTVAKKGHFVVYTADEKRYCIPISYLNNHIFRELFRMAEEEFGLPCDGPITFPCDAVIMDYLISLIKRGATKNIEKALLVSVAACRCSLSYSLHHQETIQHQISVGF